MTQEGNQLTGTMPLLAGAMSLMSLTAGSNKLTGPIPPDWWQLRQLQILSLTGKRSASDQLDLSTTPPVLHPWKCVQAML